MKILVADDDSATLLMVSALLNKFGYEVEECMDGTEAMEKLASDDPPRLAILDWVMPGMDGLQVIEKVRSSAGSRPYLLLLTSRGEMQDKVKGLDAGADDYLVKPIDPAELRARVEAGIRILKMQDRIQQQVEELQVALDQINTLHGILPICSFCKKIRNDTGYWEQVEVYIRNHSEADFSHSICPECMEKYYPGVVMPDSES